MRFKRGDRVISTKNSFTGVITSIKERGVAGSDVTFIENIKVTLDNGVVLVGDPKQFKLVEDA